MERTQVTPDGVRDGDPVALAALVARRGGAVLAFCREVCGPEVAPRAAAEAFARFRAAVYAIGATPGLDPEALLLGATRHAAASMVVPYEPPGLRRRRDGACVHVPTLLAARAAGALGAADQERLARHFQRCDSCPAVEQAFLRAERAYEHPDDGELDEATAHILLGALVNAAPVLDGDASRERERVATPPSAEPEPFEPGDGEALAGDEEDGWDAQQDEWDPDGTVEWDVLAGTDPGHDAEAATSSPGPVAELHGVRRRSGAARLLGVLLAILVLAAGAVGAAYLADVAGSSDGASPTAPAATTSPTTTTRTATTPRRAVPKRTKPQDRPIPGTTAPTTTTTAATTTTP